MDIEIIDDAVWVTDEQAFQMCHEMAKKEGLMVGGSAGLNTWAAVKQANELQVFCVTIESSLQ